MPGIGPHRQRRHRRIPPEAPWLAAKSQQWDRITAEDWIRQHLRTPAGQELARLYIRGNAAIEPSETSLLGILFDLRSVGSARNLASAEAFRLREGAHELARRVAERVGDRIRFADPVRAITQDAGGVTIESDTCALRCRRVANYGSAFRAPCGRIHWAGTETSSEWYGYMEGALRSASRAAEEMLRADSSHGAKGDQEP